MAFGTAIIIVNRICKGEKIRKGATLDYTKMETMFKELGFEVKPHYNITRSEIENEFQQASSIQSDILVFVISTHGEESHLANINSDGTKVYDQMILGSDGQTISVNHLLKQLDNDALRGKTKLCFIQACRSIKGMKGAQNLDLGVTVKVAGGKEIHQAVFDDKADDMGADSEEETDKGEGDTGVMPKLPETNKGEGEGDTGVMPKIPETELEPVKPLDDSKSEIAPDECDSEINIAPVECPRDCLVMYSVQPHKDTLRSVGKGSWMLHYMFQERHILQQNGGNVLTYLTTVLRKMADHTSTFEDQNLKLCGTIYHRLTREVFMKKM